MKVLLCSVPDGALETTLQPLLPRGTGYKFDFWNKETPTFLMPILPVGILRILTWMEKNGYYGSEIYDINSVRPPDEELIKTFKQIKPTVVGLGAALSHCYPNVKRITKLLRQIFPDIWIIVGSHLTGSSNVVLRKTETDICVVGDGEIPFVKILDYIKLHPNRLQPDFTSLSQIKGLAFIDKNNKLKVTGTSEQLPTSELQYPDYDRLRVSYEKFSGKGEWIHEHFPPVKDRFVKKGTADKKQKIYERNIDSVKDKTIAQAHTSRGCVARCTFCQRAVKGYRTYAAKDLETHILELKEKYNVGMIQIDDENAFSDKTQAYEVARVLKKCGVTWEATMRVSSVAYEHLKFFKEHNFTKATFGIEHGSQKMLDVMEKKFTKEDVFNRISECHKLEIDNDPSGIILGMPGETKETIMESAEFMASLRYVKDQDWNTAIPTDKWALAIPGTPLYEYCQQIGVIGKTLDEEEEFLTRLADEKTSILNYINITESSIEDLYYWNYLFLFTAKRAFKDLVIKNNKSIRKRVVQIYDRCIKGEIKDFIGSIKLMYRKKSHYKGKLPKFFLVNLHHLFFRLMYLSILFLPKAILLPIVRVYSNLRFYYVKKKYKVKKGKQKYNLFMEQNTDLNRKFRFTEDRIAQTTRQIERSLRNVAKVNRGNMKPAVTDEEKGLEILVQGQ